MAIQQTDANEDWLRTRTWALPYDDADDAILMVADLGDERCLALALNELPAGQPMPDDLRAAVLELIDVDQVRHLSGQHDQKSHGRKGGATGHPSNPDGAPSDVKHASVGTRTSYTELANGMQWDVDPSVYGATSSVAMIETGESSPDRAVLMKNRTTEQLTENVPAEAQQQLAAHVWSERSAISNMVGNTPIRKGAMVDADGRAIPELHYLYNTQTGHLTAMTPAAYEQRLEQTARGSSYRAFGTGRLKDAIDGGAIQHATGDDAQALVNKATMANVVQRWAGTSNDSDTEALSMQRAISEEFGLPYSAGWAHVYGVDAMYEKIGGAQRQVARSMYDETQRVLEREGITEITVFRGMKLNEPPPLRRPQNDGLTHLANGTGETVHTLRPASSFSSRETVANAFRGGLYATKLSGTIPASRVLSFPGTGFGAHGEDEFVLLSNGGPETWMTEVSE